ncbi:MAG TPA: type IV pilus assembly protein PilM, partial [Phycisphaerales bacterium]|nr:type IV pilus assembly protein PilM [Phycisphaerales bacterium]
MASGIRGIWAIDMGNNSLKALRLRSSGDKIEIIGFDYIEHSKLLAGDKSVCKEEADQIMADTLHQFVERNDVLKDEVAISMAGQNSFSRFIKLPPVEAKGIPKIVQYEAVQQIPFDINEVEWDWQLMSSEDSAEAEVGIFAIKNELINEKMSVFAKDNLKVSSIQVSPMALYNYLTYDQKESMDADNKPVVIIDVGAENTTLVVCSKTAVWQRTIRIGGNTFTEAIADAFKLRFRKAEKLKRHAPMSKYIRQLFSAMKPVFTDIGSEIQRSLGFYSSSHEGHEGFSKVIALGGGMKLQGLAKYLQKNLGVPVIKPDSFEKLEISPELSAAKFHENVSDFATAYGLGVQMLGEAKIDINLLPKKLATAMMWARKGRNFTIAASALLAVSILSFASAKYAKGNYDSRESVSALRSVETVIEKARSASSNWDKEKGRESKSKNAINKQLKLFQYRDVIPMLLESVTSCLPNAVNNPDQAELYAAFEAGDVGKVQTWPRKERKQVFVTSTVISYTDSLLNAKFEAMKKRQEKQDVGMDMNEMWEMMGGGM